MSWKTWIPLVLALVLGLLAAKVGWDIVAQKRHPLTASGELNGIVVAGRDLAPGQVLQEDDLTLAMVAKDHVPRTAFRSISELSGRVIVMPMVRSQPVLETMLAPTGANGGPQSLVPEGMRAVTVDVNEERGLGGLLTPGCRVDVVSTLLDENAKCPVARTIAQNVSVLAVGQRLTPGKKDDEATIAKTVTLVVTPQQGEAVELASNSGRIRLLLRSSTDTSVSNARGTTVADLLGGQPPKLDFLASWPKAPASPVAAVQPAAVASTPAVATSPLQVRNEPKPGRRWTVEVISGTSDIAKVEFDLPGDLKPQQFTGTGTGIEPAIPGQESP